MKKHSYGGIQVGLDEIEIPHRPRGITAADTEPPPSCHVTLKKEAAHLVAHLDLTKLHTVEVSWTRPDTGAIGHRLFSKARITIEGET